MTGRNKGLRSGLLGLAAAVVVSLVLLSAIWLRPQAPMPELPAPLATQVRGPTVIVLPFENLSGAQDDDLVAAGLTEQLTAALMRFGELRLYSAFVLAPKT